MPNHSVTLQPVGSIGLADLAAICWLEGLEYLPYPFFTHTWLPGIAPQSGTIADRLADGDLRDFRPWMKAYTQADIWVECQVHYSAPETPAVRIAACRINDSGFVAAQQPGKDMVDVFTVSAYEIGSAIAASVGLTTPGTHSRIIAPPFFIELGRTADDTNTSEDHGVLVPVASRGRTGTGVLESDVTAMAVVQSRCDPAREARLGQGRKAVGWLRVRDDGEYIYAPDFSHATPVTPQILGKQIDQMIGKDVAVLRHRRRVH